MNSFRSVAFTFAATTLLGLALLAPSADARTTLKGDWRFEGNLKSSVKGAPRLGSVGKGNRFAREKAPGEGRTRVFRFKRGNGLKLKTSKLIPSKEYSVVMQFRLALAGTDDYSRILNATLPADDNDDGLYVYANQLFWYDDDDVPGLEGTFSGDKYREVAFTRKADGHISVYVKGVHDITYMDATGDGIIRKHLLRFFIDNGNNEDSAGAVSRIRVYKGALNAKKVKRIYNKGH